MQVPSADTYDASWMKAQVKKGEADSAKMPLGRRALTKKNICGLSNPRVLQIESCHRETVSRYTVKKRGIVL